MEFLTTFSFWYNIAIFNCIAIGLIILFYRKKFDYWKQKNVYCPEPTFLYGHTKDVILQKKGFGMSVVDIYNEHRSRPFLGIYSFYRPMLILNDLDLIKNIMTKDFANFTDRGMEFDPENDPILGHLFSEKGERWKNLRAKLTPTFTSNKMRRMFDVIFGCATELDDYLETSIVKNELEDVKEVLGKFSNDVIASCAFGIECKSFENPNNKFREMGKRAVTPSARDIAMSCAAFFCPKLFSKLGLRMVDKKLEEFFFNVVNETVKYREENGIVRSDFLDILIDLKNGKTDKAEPLPDDGTRLTMMQLAAQVFVFFIAGFETSSTTASFALYELALNPDIQKTLAEEIDDVLTKHDGKVTYDSLGDMVYMTKVIEETMRKYPALPVLFRICTKDYIIPDTDIKIEKDTPVMIPIYGIQRDPQFYPNPNKFDPERFTPENKAARHHFSYLPFGEGPRICIGSRFGMMQTKLGLATFLSKYEVSVCEKTLIPMEYDKRSFVLTSDGGVWLKLTKRVK